MKKTFYLLLNILFTMIILCAFTFGSNFQVSQESSQGESVEIKKIRIVKKNASLRLKPNRDSLIIKNIAIGANLFAEEYIGDWMKVSLPPDKDGIVITGYIHESFIEIEKSVLREPEKEINKSEEKNIETIMEREAYFEWERELARAKNKKNSGIPLIIIGTAIISPSLYFVLRGPGEGCYYYTWAKILIGAGILSGTICMVLGVTNMSRGQVLLKQLKEEGRLRGYIVAGLLPEYRAIGLQIKISF